jgi:pullulanase
VFEHKDKGFASGKEGMEESIKFGVVASLQHPDIDYSKVNYSKAPYSAAPHNTISYCECHDNHVLWDKLGISCEGLSEKQREEIHKLALSIVLTSQGISFLHAGTEFLRSKQGVENSFESGDSINAIDWNLKTKHLKVFKYVQALIQMRKQHPAFRMTSSDAIAANIRFYKSPTGTVVYTINGKAVGDTWKKILIIYNGNTEISRADLPKGQWEVYIRSNQLSGTPTKISTSLELLPSSCTVLFQK